MTRPDTAPPEEIPVPVLRPGRPDDAATAAVLLLASGGELLRAGFGFADEADIRAVLSVAWPLPGHPLSVAHATVAVVDDRAVGLLLCNTGPDRHQHARDGGRLFGRLIPERVRRRLPEEAGNVPAAPEDALFVGSLAVLPAYRRRGIAGRLLDHAEALSRTLRCASVVLDVLDTNLAARRLYARRGFRVASTWRWPDAAVPPILRLRKATDPG